MWDHPGLGLGLENQLPLLSAQAWGSRGLCSRLLGGVPALEAQGLELSEPRARWGPVLLGRLELGANLVAVTWPSLSGVGHCLVHWLPLPHPGLISGVLGGGKGENDHFDTYAGLWWGLVRVSGLWGQGEGPSARMCLPGMPCLGSLLPMV